MESNNHRLMIRIDQVQPSVESLEEMTVHTSNFAAEYGQVAGGIFNLTAKSGTNTFRGSLFEYYVHEKFGAGIPFTNDGRATWCGRRTAGTTSAAVSAVHFRFPGTTEAQQDVLLLQLRAVPPARDQSRPSPDDADRPDAQRRLRRSLDRATAGDVDPLGRPIMENAIYDPRTTRVVNGQVVRDPFPGNVIPQELFDPVALKIQDDSFPPRRGRD